MSRPLLSRRALLLGLLAAPVVSAKPTSRFTFKIPPGWTDMLADGLQDSVVTHLHPSLAAQLLLQDHLAFAVDLDPKTHGQNSFMQAILLEGKIEVSDETLPEIRRQIEQNNKDKGVQITILSAEILEMGGGDVARVIWEVKNDEGNEMRMAYLLPAGEEPAVMLLYGSNAADFPKVRPLMEASALATTGVVPLPRWRKYFIKSLPYIQIVGAIGLIVLLLSGRKKQSIITPVRPRTSQPEEEPAEEKTFPPGPPFRKEDRGKPTPGEVRQ
ncbi:MAG: hypothetical protein RMJ98_10250 [Myxococcales bacterium]|nr:hypothetical protein [Polyangiaceae bacterium]MDW8249668.1 hypothetical protein [Myxococcales bacterium]